MAPFTAAVEQVNFLACSFIRALRRRGAAHQGDYQTQRSYGAGPLLRLEYYLRQEAEVLHLVDLSGARDPTRARYRAYTAAGRSGAAIVQVSGGIRSAADVEVLLEAGATRVVVGSTTVRQPLEVQR